MKIDRLDHVVLTVRDVDRTCAFYARVLNLEVVTYGQGRRALQVGTQTINLHELGREHEPKAGFPTAGSADFCLVVEDPIEDVIATLEARGVRLEEGPVERTGATGPITSVYFRDPDGNLIELAHYEPH